jgi:hypothetical protein
VGFDTGPTGFAPFFSSCLFRKSRAFPPIFTLPSLIAFLSPRGPLPVSCIIDFISLLETLGLRDCPVFTLPFSALASVLSRVSPPLLPPFRPPPPPPPPFRPPPPPPPLLGRGVVGRGAVGVVGRGAVGVVGRGAVGVVGRGAVGVVGRGAVGVGVGRGPAPDPPPPPKEIFRLIPNYVGVADV